jgi:hypothetical protein
VSNGPYVVITQICVFADQVGSGTRAEVQEVHAEFSGRPADPASGLGRRAF